MFILEYRKRQALSGSGTDVINFMREENMPKVIIYTKAYNAQKTLKRAIESILNQSYGDFVYYVLDNGSTDKTGNIIAEYSKKDSRIKPLRFEINNVPPEGTNEMDFLDKYGDDCYYVNLDADDEYKPDFLKKMLDFIKNNNLSVAACGSDFIDTATGKIIGLRQHDKNLIIEGDGFSKHFPYYYIFMRTQWAKIYSLSTFRKPSYKEYKLIPYGYDTIVSMKNFYNSTRVGILHESLHKYYLSTKSVSYKFDNTRIESSTALYDAACDYLLYKCGFISAQNKEFLLCTYMESIKDTLAILLNAPISLSEKLDGLNKLMSSTQTKQLAKYKNIGIFNGFREAPELRKEIFLTAAKWLLSLNEVPDEQVESFIDTGEFVSAAAEYAEGWIFFNKLRIRFLLDQGRKVAAKTKLAEIEPLLPNDAEIRNFHREIFS